jgi:hypothetical protein
MIGGRRVWKVCSLLSKGSMRERVVRDMLVALHMEGREIWRRHLGQECGSFTEFVQVCTDLLCERVYLHRKFVRTVVGMDD